MKEEEQENSQGILHKCALATGKCEQWLRLWEKGNKNFGKVNYKSLF